MVSRIDSSPRKIKRIQTPINEEIKNKQAYQFFQQIICTSILLLKDEKGIIER